MGEPLQYLLDNWVYTLLGAGLLVFITVFAVQTLKRREERKHGETPEDHAAVEEVVAQFKPQVTREQYVPGLGWVTDAAQNFPDDDGGVDALPAEPVPGTPEEVWAATFPGPADTQAPQEGAALPDEEPETYETHLWPAGPTPSLREENESADTNLAPQLPAGTEGAGTYPPADIWGHTSEQEDVTTETSDDAADQYTQDTTPGAYYDSNETGAEPSEPVFETSDDTEVLDVPVVDVAGVEEARSDLPEPLMAAPWLEDPTPRNSANFFPTVNYEEAADEEGAEYQEHDEAPGEPAFETPQIFDVEDIPTPAYGLEPEPFAAPAETSWETPPTLEVEVGEEDTEHQEYDEAPEEPAFETWETPQIFDVEDIPAPAYGLEPEPFADPDETSWETPPTLEVEVGEEDTEHQEYDEAPEEPAFETLQIFDVEEELDGGQEPALEVGEAVEPVRKFPRRRDLRKAAQDAEALNAATPDYPELDYGTDSYDATPGGLENETTDYGINPDTAYPYEAETDTAEDLPEAPSEATYDAHEQPAPDNVWAEATYPPEQAETAPEEDTKPRKKRFWSRRKKKNEVEPETHPEYDTTQTPAYENTFTDTDFAYPDHQPVDQETQPTEYGEAPDTTYENQSENELGYGNTATQEWTEGWLEDLPAPVAPEPETVEPAHDHAEHGYQASTEPAYENTYTESDFTYPEPPLENNTDQHYDETPSWQNSAPQTPQWENTFNETEFTYNQEPSHEEAVEPEFNAATEPPQEPLIWEHATDDIPAPEPQTDAPAVTKAEQRAQAKREAAALKEARERERAEKARAQRAEKLRKAAEIEERKRSQAAQKAAQKEAAARAKQEAREKARAEKEKKRKVRQKQAMTGGQNQELTAAAEAILAAARARQEPEVPSEAFPNLNVEELPEVPNEEPEQISEGPGYVIGASIRQASSINYTQYDLPEPLPQRATTP